MVSMHLPQSHISDIQCYCLDLGQLVTRRSLSSGGVFTTVRNARSGQLRTVLLVF